MASTLEQLVVKLDADIGGFTSQMAQASSDFQRQSQEISSSAGSISQQLSGLKDSFGSLSDKLDYIVTPIKLVGTALAALGLDKIAEQAKNAIAEVANLTTQADRLQITTEKLQQLQYAARTLGDISPSNFQTASLALAEKAADNVRNRQGDLMALFKANNLSLTDQEGNVKSIDQLWLAMSKLIEGAKSETDKVDMASKAGQARDMVGFLEQGPDAIKKTADAANAAGEVLDAAMIAKAQEFNDRWNKTADTWTHYFRAAIVDIGAAIDWLITKAENMAGPVLNIADRIGQLIRYFDTANKMRTGPLFESHGLGGNFAIGGPGEGTSALTLEEAQFAKKTYEDALAAAQRKQAAGETLSSEEAAALKGGPLQPGNELDAAIAQRQEEQRMLNASTRPPIVIGKKLEPYDGGDTIDPGTNVKKAAKEKLDQFDREEKASQRRVEALNRETDAIGLNTFAAAKSEEQSRLTDAAQRANLEVTPELTAEIEKQATAYAHAKNALEQAKLAQNEWKDAQNFLGNSLVDITASATKGMDGLKQAVDSLVDSLLKAVLQAALLGQGPLAGLFHTGTTSNSGIGGLIGSLAGAIGNPFAKGTVSGGPIILPGAVVPQGHSGGIVGAGGGIGGNPFRMVPLSLFAGAPRFHSGMASDEFPAILQRGEEVRTAAQQRAHGASQIVNVNIENHTDASVKVQQTQASNGQINVRALISQAVAQDIANPGSGPHQALKKVFGARTQLMRR